MRVQCNFQESLIFRGQFIRSILSSFFFFSFNDRILFDSVYRWLINCKILTLCQTNLFIKYGNMRVPLGLIKVASDRKAQSVQSSEPPNWVVISTNCTSASNNLFFTFPQWLNCIATDETYESFSFCSLKYWNVFCWYTKNVYLCNPLFNYGPDPMYAIIVSPLVISVPGILTTTQWNHSDIEWSVRPGASGSSQQSVIVKSIVVKVFVSFVEKIVSYPALWTCKI